MNWLRNAVVYAVDVTSFLDTDGDGCGDLRGVHRTLDYVADLGATCVWLQPFYPSPRFDDGYDVVDHVAVDERLGTLDDVRAIVDGAHRRGMRVVLDLVVNHTSERHPWFRTRPSMYIRRDEPDPDVEAEPIFPEVSDDVWIRDPEVGDYYLSRFYPHEPELDTGRPGVLDEIERIQAFWLDVGVDGFRVDAAPYIVQKAKWTDPTDGGHWVLRRLHEHLAAHRGDGVLIGETDVPPEAYVEYLGDGQLDGTFDFYTNNHLFFALATEQAAPLRHALRARPGLDGVLVHWVRNHDELDLERLDKEDRHAVYRAFAPESSMRLYGRGIRRRYPPMVDGDRRRVELAYAIVASLPGAFVLRYGEEIGMGDDPSAPERMAMRAVMQWTSEPRAGFTTGSRIQRPFVPDGPFGPEAVNVADQLADPGSLLHWFRRLLAVRRSLPEIGTVECEVVDGPDPLLVLRYGGVDRSVVVLHNLSSRPVEATAPEGEVAMVFPHARPVSGATLRLDPYASAWLVARTP